MVHREISNLLAIRHKHKKNKLRHYSFWNYIDNLIVPDHG
jgi:hypothetical protein